MASEKFSYEDFTEFLCVPRETYGRLEDYVDLLRKWQSTINLISAATLAQIWVRHIIDSAQLIDKISDESVVDLGSGAGFPGLIIAILGARNVTLVESDARKVAFLREAARVTSTGVIIIHDRIENVDLGRYSLIVARGFAPLEKILEIIGKGLRENHKMLLLKGKKYESEVTAAQMKWTFDHRIFPSITEKEGVILLVQNIKKRGSHE